MQIAFALYPGLTALDFVGPYNVLSNVPGVDVVLCTAEPGVLADEHGLLRLQIDTALADVPSTDIVVVPGGPGSRVGRWGAAGCRSSWSSCIRQSSARRFIGGAPSPRVRGDRRCAASAS